MPVQSQVKDSIRTQLQNAIALTDDSLYIQADSVYLNLINQSEILPDEFCYHFGRNLLGNHRNRLGYNFLEKYIQLQGDAGTYYMEALTLLKLEDLQMHLSVDSIPDRGHAKKQPCKDGNLIQCPICHGSGVLIQESNMGKVYSPCPYSDESGLMECWEYKEYLKGNLIKHEE